LNVFLQGILRGEGTSFITDKTTHIAVDQGIDSTESGLSFKSSLSDDLVETAFLIRADHRLIQIHQLAGNSIASGVPAVSSPLVNQFVDDDGVASYYVSIGDGTSCVEGKPGTGAKIIDARAQIRPSIIGNSDPLTFAETFEAFEGPLGSILRIYPRTSMHVRQSTALFNEIGTTITSGKDIVIKGDYTLSTYKYIDTLINVVGVTTGYSIDIPIRIVKRTS